MAASVAATMSVAGSVVPLRNASGLSSSASFRSPIVTVAPFRTMAKRNVMIARAALPEDQSGRAARREMLAGLVAAGAALVSAGNALAASGPGIPGGKKTNDQAESLLKKADDLTNQQSPPRFGEGAADAGRIAQQSGSGAVEGLQGSTIDAVEGSKNAIGEAKAKFDELFSEKKFGDLSSANVLDDASGKVSSDIDTTKKKVESDISTTSEKVKNTDAGSFFGLGKNVDETKDKAKSLVSDAQTNLDGKVGSGKSLVDNLADRFQKK